MLPTLGVQVVLRCHGRGIRAWGRDPRIEGFGILLTDSLAHVPCNPLMVTSWNFIPPLPYVLARGENSARHPVSMIKTSGFHD